MTSVPRAKISGGYTLRLAVLALAFLGWAAWSLYDGAVAYPHQRHVALEFQRYEDEGRIEEWPAYARSQGWSEEDPGRPRSNLDIAIQYGMAGIALPIGLVFGFVLIRSAGRWIEMRDDRFVTSWGQEVPLAAITAIDKTRWDEKGIAVLHYKADNIDNTLVLDDWKFERSAIDAMVEKVDAVLQAAAQPQRPPSPPAS